MFATDAQWQQFIAKELRDFLLAHVRKQMARSAP
jgi:hypothetical protein